mmetsp:Transcript_16660/g.47511  ORF Transcript_16660/g.47511 Transcript_16660/m.47511 type:complete len:488 (-) Transcript_16660:125-1588(-)
MAGSAERISSAPHRCCRPVSIPNSSDHGDDAKYTSAVASCTRPARLKMRAMPEVCAADERAQDDDLLAQRSSSQRFADLSSVSKLPSSSTPQRHTGRPRHPEVTGRSPLPQTFSREHQMMESMPQPLHANSAGRSSMNGKSSRPCPSSGESPGARGEAPASCRGTSCLEPTPLTLTNSSGSSPRTRPSSRVRHKPPAMSGIGDANDQFPEISLALHVTINLRPKSLTIHDLASWHQTPRVLDQNQFRSAPAQLSNEHMGPFEEDAHDRGRSLTAAKSSSKCRGEVKIERCSITASFEEQMHSICPDSPSMVCSGQGSLGTNGPGQTGLALVRKQNMTLDRRVNTPPASDRKVSTSPAHQRLSSDLHSLADSSAWANRARSSGAERGVGAGGAVEMRREARQTPLREESDVAFQQAGLARPPHSTRGRWRRTADAFWQGLSDAKSALFTPHPVKTVASIQKRIDDEALQDLGLGSGHSRKRRCHSCSG